MTTIVASLLCSSLLASSVSAPVGSGRGWFYYEVAPASPSPPAPETLDDTVPPPLSARWMRTYLDQYRDAAIDRPTPANVRLYLELQRYALDRAEGFAKATTLAVMQEPGLDEAQRGPISGAQQAVAEPETRAERQRVIAGLAGDTGLWFFFRSDCPYCRQQAGALSAFSARYGLSVLPISLDGAALAGGAFPDYVVDHGQAAALAVGATPSLFLMRSDGELVRLAQGLQSLPELEERVLALGHQAGWIDADDYRKASGRRAADSDDEDAAATRRARLLDLLARARPVAALGDVGAESPP